MVKKFFQSRLKNDAKVPVCIVLIVAIVFFASGSFFGFCLKTRRIEGLGGSFAGASGDFKHRESPFEEYQQRVEYFNKFKEQRDSAFTDLERLYYDNKRGDSCPCCRSNGDYKR